jgi:hypothetical protein
LISEEEHMAKRQNRKSARGSRRVSRSESSYRAKVPVVVDEAVRSDIDEWVREGEAKRAEIEARISAGVLPPFWKRHS